MYCEWLLPSLELNRTAAFPPLLPTQKYAFSVLRKGLGWV